jgi:phosphatidylinositol glycan class V
VPYTEPLYAAFTFSGFYFSMKGRWVLAAFLLALATGTRAMGVFNIGILGWHVLFGNGLPGANRMRPRVSRPRRVTRRSNLTRSVCSVALLWRPRCA